jgi:hypothetical protein
MRYQRIVFLQGEEADEALAILDNDGTEAALEFLAQWDYGDAGETFDEPANGSDDEVYEDEAQHYRMSWNNRLGYIGLEGVEQ